MCSLIAPDELQSSEFSDTCLPQLSGSWSQILMQRFSEVESCSSLDTYLYKGSQWRDCSCQTVAMHNVCTEIISLTGISLMLFFLLCSNGIFHFCHAFAAALNWRLTATNITRTTDFKCCLLSFDPFPIAFFLRLSVCVSVCACMRASVCVCVRVYVVWGYCIKFLYYFWGLCIYFVFLTRLSEVWFAHPCQWETMLQKLPLLLLLLSTDSLFRGVYLPPRKHYLWMVNIQMNGVKIQLMTDLQISLPLDNLYSTEWSLK